MQWWYLRNAVIIKIFPCLSAIFHLLASVKQNVYWWLNSAWLLCVNCHICSCYGKQICWFVVDWEIVNNGCCPYASQENYLLEHGLVIYIKWAPELHQLIHLHWVHLGPLPGLKKRFIQKVVFFCVPYAACVYESACHCIIYFFYIFQLRQ